MATLPRRDLDDLASLAGEADHAGPDAGREAAVTEALRSMPQQMGPDPRFTAHLRDNLLRRAGEAERAENAPAAVSAPVRPE